VPAPDQEPIMGANGFSPRWAKPCDASVENAATSPANKSPLTKGQFRRIGIDPFECIPPGFGWVFISLS
jgi:hypothetical protein